MYVNDFDGNGSLDQIIACYNQDVSYPLPLRDDLLRALPFLKSRFPSYKDYARKTMQEIFTAAELGDAVVKHAYTFATALVRNNGDGSFTLVPLPTEAQIAPVYGILATDVDHDGSVDLLLAGNFDGFKPEIGSMRASFGLLLRGNSRGRYTPVRTAESGFFVPGQSRDIQRLRGASGDLYVVSRNNDRPLIFRGTTSRPVVVGQRSPRERAGTVSSPSGREH